MSKQEIWFVVARPADAASPDRGISAGSAVGPADAERLALEVAGSGDMAYVCRAVAIVHPPKKAEPTIERLPGAPRKRRTKAAPLETGMPEMRAMAMGNEAAASVALEGEVDLLSGMKSIFSEARQKSRDAPPPPLTSDMIIQAQIALRKEAQASVALDKGDGETRSVDDDEAPLPCPACDAGGAPVKGKHTNMETGKRYPCPRAKAQKGDA